MQELLGGEERRGGGERHWEIERVERGAGLNYYRRERLVGSLFVCCYAVLRFIPTQPAGIHEWNLRFIVARKPAQTTKIENGVVPR